MMKIVINPMQYLGKTDSPGIDSTSDFHDSPNIQETVIVGENISTVFLKFISVQMIFKKPIYAHITRNNYGIYTVIESVKNL